MARTLTLRTHRPAAECHERLAAAVLPIRAFRSPAEVQRDLGILRAGGDPSVVRGSVTPDSFRLVRSLPVRNSFKTEARGRLVQSRDHTDVELRFGVASGVFAFSTVWLGMAVLFIAIGGFLAMRDGGGAVLLVAFTLLFPAFYALVYVLGRRMARGDEAYLSSFICRVLDARPVPAVPPHRG